MIDPDFPTSLPAFQDRFNDEEACLAYLRRQKWPEGFRCPRCEHAHSWTIQTRRLEECAGCGHQASLTAGTMFHGTRKPLSLWFRAVFEFISRKHGCNAMDLQRLLGLSRKVAWAWLHKIRDAMVDPDRAPLSGTVQIDETMIGATEEGVYGRSRGSKKHLIVGAVEEQGHACGRARLAPVGRATKELLQIWVAENVAEGSRARTDGLQGYDGLEHAYDHEVDVIGKDGRKAVVKFPHIHLVFALFKRVVESTYQGSISPKYLRAYCNEFVFRFNRRRAKSRTHLLQRVLENAVRRPPRVHVFVRRDDITDLMAA